MKCQKAVTVEVQASNYRVNVDFTYRRILHHIPVSTGHWSFHPFIS